MNKMKLSKWAESNGKTYKEAWNLVDKGEFPGKVERNKSGSIFVLEESKASQPAVNKNVTFATPQVVEHHKKQEITF